MPFSFPASPTVGQQSTQNGRVYQYTSAGVWELVAVPQGIQSTNISDSTAAGRAILTAADAAAQRTAMSAANATHASQHQSDGSDPVPISIPSTIALTGSVNDWLPNSGNGDILRFTCSTALNITGISSSMKARAIVICNVGASNNATVLGQSTSSAAGNRIILSGGAASVILTPNTSLALWYDSEAARWRGM